MTNFAYEILKFESVIIKPLVSNQAFFAVVTFSKIIDSIITEPL